MGDLLCGFEIAPGRVCKRPAPCSIATHLVADPEAMLATAREAAARGKEVFVSVPRQAGKTTAARRHLEAMDRADAELDAIPIEQDPAGWQPADQPAIQWGGPAEFTEINTAVWAGATYDPGRIEECLTMALGALGSIAGRSNVDLPTQQTAAHALRRMRQRAESGPLPAYPRGPRV